MRFTAVKIAASDNVVTVLKDVAEGEMVTFSDAGSVGSVTAAEAIPIYHKIALCELKQGDTVYKYGESLGKLNRDVVQGAWISDSVLESQPRCYDEELSELK